MGYQTVVVSVVIFLCSVHISCAGESVIQYTKLMIGVFAMHAVISSYGHSIDNRRLFIG